MSRSSVETKQDSSNLSNETEASDLTLARGSSAEQTRHSSFYLFIST